MPEQDRHDVLELSIEGQALERQLYGAVRSCRVQTSVTLPDAITVRFNDPHFRLLDEQLVKVGDSIAVKLRVEGDLRPAAEGEVIALSVERNRKGDHELVVEALDPTHRLHRGVKSRTFADMTDADIATQIAQEHALSAKVEATGAVEDFVLQLNQTDFQFLSARARRLGFQLWVADGALFFQKRYEASGASPGLTWGDNLLDFTVRFSSTERCDETTVLGFDSVNKMELEATAAAPDLDSTASAGADFRNDARHVFGSIERIAGQFGVHSETEARQVAEGLAHTAMQAEVQLSGEAAGDPRIAAGATVKIERVGTRLAGEYLVREVEHVYEAGRPYVTRFWCGQHRTPGLGGLPGQDQGFKPWGGLTLAMVADIDDPEDLGRIKVKFTDLRKTDSSWAHLATLGAGAKRGLHLGHEIGDVVVVGFEHDDFQRPIVLGSIWNREDAVPRPGSVADGKTETRTLQTRDGHHLTFTDKEKGQLELGLGTAPPRLLLEPAESRLEGEESLIVEADKITIRAGQELILEAPSIKVDGDRSVKVTSHRIELN